MRKRKFKSEKREKRKTGKIAKTSGKSVFLIQKLMREKGKKA